MRLTVFGVVRDGDGVEGKEWKKKDEDIKKNIDILYSSDAKNCDKGIDGHACDTACMEEKEKAGKNSCGSNLGMKDDVSINRLKELGVEFNYFLHEEAHTIDTYRPHCEKNCPEGKVCKNLFCKDKKKKKVMAIIVALAETDVSITIVQNYLKLKNLRMASSDTLKDVLGLKAGAVTPLGLVNDTDNFVSVFLDQEMVECGKTHPLCVHPTAGNHCTVTLKSDALGAYIASTNHQYHVVDFTTGEVSGPF
eukprot:m.1836 g.1836  ORF g.1836 m.1836 type:complete len:250 (+) comp1639_c0_seq1:52-801(+)